MKKMKKPILLMVIVFGIMIYFSYIIIGQQSLLHTKQLELTGVQQKIKDETKENEELKKQSEAIKSDEYAEKVAREKLNMVRKDERVFVDVNK